MGEAIISRHGSIYDPLNDVASVPGYHVFLLTLKDFDGKPMQNYTVSCRDSKDSSNNYIYYHYNTNSKGQCLFTTNSGMVNIIIENTVSTGNGKLQYLDFDTTNKSFPAPIGYKSMGELQLVPSSGEHGLQYISGINNIGYRVLKSRSLTITLVGGGQRGSYHYGDVPGQNGQVARATLSLTANTIYWSNIGGTNSLVDGAAGGTSHFGNLMTAVGGGVGGGGGAAVPQFFNTMMYPGIGGYQSYTYQGVTYYKDIHAYGGAIYYTL